MEQFAPLPSYIVINSPPASSFGCLWNIKCSCSQSLSRMTIQAISCLAEPHWHHTRSWNACVTVSHLKRFHISVLHLWDWLCDWLVFADRLPSWVVCFSHCPVVWAGPRSRSRWWHSLACATHWWHQFPYHKASSKVQALRSYVLTRSLLSHLWSPTISKLTLAVVLTWQLPLDLIALDSLCIYILLSQISANTF